MNNNDSGPGSLRQAIASASAGDTIVVPANTYTLTSGALAIAKSLTITGAGANSTFIDGNGTSRVFETSGTTSNIRIGGVTIRDGNAPVASATAEGGGVFNSNATLTLSDDVIDGDTAIANGAGPGGSGGNAFGGGVFSSGTLNLIDSRVSNDIASANGNSGQFAGDAFGGGIESEGTLTVIGSTFISDTVLSDGGSGSDGTNAWGGGLSILPAGPSSVSSSTFTANVVEATGNAGGGNAWGGAIFLDTNSPAVSATNLVVTGNIARTSAGGEATGGLSWGSNSPVVTLTNLTISANIASGAANGFNVGNAALGGPNTHVANTIISAGVGDPGRQNCGGAPTSLGHNLDSLDQCAFHTSGDIVNADPRLGPLEDNGGPVETMALTAGSPAIDAGANAGCPATDARGALRPAGNACDIGSFEVATPAATTDPATSEMLRGVAFNPDIAPGTAFFQYGTTTAYGSNTPAQPVPATAQNDTVTAPLPQLAPGDYHYRLVVTNGVATETGADMTFTVAPEVVSKVVPQLTHLKLRHRRFRAGKGTRINYIDSAAATTTFLVERRVHHRWLRVRRFTHSDKLGHNRFHFAGHKLAPGRYRLVALPTLNDVTGNAVTAAFRILA